MRTNSTVTSEADSVRKLEKDELKKDELDLVSGGLSLATVESVKKMDLKGASESIAH